MSCRALTWSILGSAAIVSLGVPSAALSQSEADFFKGKTVNYVIATAPGGGYDYYGRLVAEYMQKHIPGSTFVVRNMPGAGHIIGTNFIYASKPDGLTIGTFNTGLIYNQLVGVDSLKADLTKMSWIGKASTDPRAFVISANSPIKTFADLQASQQIIFSTSGVGSGGYAETKVLSEMLNLPIRLVTGYNGNDDQLAMRRGEVTGTINTRSSWDAFVKNGYARYLVQIGGRDKDVPQLSSFVKGDDAKAVVALIASQGEIGRLTAGPPGIPPARLEFLRNAYKAAMEDKELQDKAAKGGRPDRAALWRRCGEDGEDLARPVSEDRRNSEESAHRSGESRRAQGRRSAAENRRRQEDHLQRCGRQAGEHGSQRLAHQGHHRRAGSATQSTQGRANLRDRLCGECA